MFNRSYVPWVDEKYVMMLDQVVDRFHVINTNPLKVGFRCPFCGDSKKSKTKTRAALFMTPDGTMFKCLNCDHPSNLRGVLKRVNERMYNEYVAETRFKAETQPQGLTLTPKVVHKLTERGLEPASRNVRNVGLPTIQSLSTDHPARKYWDSRKMPASRMADAHWCERYYKWVNDVVIPGKFKNTLLAYDCGRIVFPFRNADGIVVGYTGRSIGGEQPKYVAIKVADDPAPFGAERVDPTKTVYVVEGPIDSLFITNAVAMGTSNRKVDYPDQVYVFDNEPRNESIVNIVSAAVKRGDRVVIWPRGMEHKDINEMVLAGIDVNALVRDRTFSGLRARVEFTQWLGRI
mgnify:CR=1 FL=1